MTARVCRVGLAICLVALALLSPRAVLAGEPAQSAPPDARDQQLGEVLVEGERTRRKFPTFEEYQESFDFLARLVGQFHAEGSVDLRAQGRVDDLRPVSGRAECVGFGVGPGVQCELRIRWPGTTGPNDEEIPGGFSTLNPAILLFGFESADATLRPAGVGLRSQVDESEEPKRPGVSYILIDSKGIAERAIGEMATPNTLRSRSKCTAIRGDCERVAVITALPDLKTVDINIDLVIDGRKAVSFFFQLNRLPGSESVVYGRKDRRAR